jgi:hypothetical protein
LASIPSSCTWAPGRAEHRLGVEHRRGRQRTDGGAFRVVEREQDNFAAELLEGDLSAELVG